jgi:hypothetical protein
MQSLLLIGNAKRLSDTFVSVDAVFECRSCDTIQSVYEELEYVLNQSDYYHMTVLFGKFCSGNIERIFLLLVWTDTPRGISCDIMVRVVILLSEHIELCRCSVLISQSL